jgi:hypothetical protein
VESEGPTPPLRYGRFLDRLGITGVEGNRKDSVPPAVFAADADETAFEEGGGNGGGDGELDAGCRCGVAEGAVAVELVEDQLLLG